MARESFKDKHLDLCEKFQTLQLAEGGKATGYVPVDQLREAFEAAGLKLFNHKIRELQAKWRTGKTGDAVEQMDAAYFFELMDKLLTEQDPGFKKQVKKLEDAKEVHGQTGIHVIKDVEQAAFADWMNKSLADDKEAKVYLPLKAGGDDLYERCSDGVLLCKMINKAQPGTIFEKSINLPAGSGKQLSIYQKLENGTLAINSAKSLGCKIVNIEAGDLQKGTPYLVLGLIWQVIKMGLLVDITLAQHAELVLLLEPGESLDDLRRLSAEQLLMRWVNYHLAKSGTSRRIGNFEADLHDSEVYTRLLKQVAPEDKHVTTLPLNEADLYKRAGLMLNEADKLNCRVFITPESILANNSRLNLAFLANLFNNYPGLQKPAEHEDLYKETREEKTYRNWMNSLGVNPYVNYLYTDLRDGLILFQLYDIIQPGIVDWKRVHKEFAKLKVLMEKLENCNYAVELGKKLGFSLVGIGGEDILNGNQTLTLALIWQTMRAYTLAILSKLAGTGKPIADKDIVAWANSKLEGSGKGNLKITGFNDSKISTGHVVLELLNILRPGCIKSDWVTPGNNVEEKLVNAKYAITAARQQGALVYALPEDIVEVKQKMVLTIFACLMMLEHQQSVFQN